MFMHGIQQKQMVKRPKEKKTLFYYLHHKISKRVKNDYIFF